jgi:hypothetical protein
VLEARGRDGEPVYFTEATRLAFGDREVPAASLRVWDRGQIVRVRWLTVEGFKPYLEVASAAELDEFRLEEAYRADWPTTWTVPGSTAGRYALQRAEGVAERVPDFGTQRFAARIELWQGEEDLAPTARFVSPGAREAMERPDEFPTAVLALPGAVGPASRAFGLAQLEIAPTANSAPDLRGRIDDLVARRLAFSRLGLLAATIRAAGRDPESLRWREIELGAGDGPRWGEGVAGAGAIAAGDLLQSGGRTVVLVRDAGAPGELDPDDLCLDFARGARLRPLREVFSGGPGELRLDWAALTH